MVHAHFLQMGGFRLVCTKQDILKGPAIVPSSQDKFRLSSVIRPNRKYLIPPQFSFRSRDKQLIEGVIGLESFRELLRQQLIDFPEISREDISDKSKGDILSKGIALIQIGWFLLQLVARSHENLAITELELTTAALAALNFAMYICWWDKPQDVRCPVVIRTKETEKLLAGTEVKDDWELDPANDFEHFRLRDYLATTFKAILTSITGALRNAYSGITNLPQNIWRLCVFLFSSTRSAWNGVLDRIYSQSRSEGVTDEKGNKGGHCSTSEQRRGHNIERAATLFAFVPWLLKEIVVKLVAMQYLPMFLPAKLILSRHQDIFDITIDKSSDDAKVRMASKPLLELLFSKIDMMWIMSMIFYSEQAESAPLFYSSAIGGAIFGSIHCFAWKFDFPSRFERILWRSASFSIVGVCMCVVPGIFIHTALRKREKSSKDNSVYVKYFWISMRKVCELIPCIIYPIARASLLLLAIASLRDIPSSALDAVQWIQLIPHI